MSTFLLQSFPVAMTGAVGSTQSFSALLNTAFGANASSITGAWISHYGLAALQEWNYDYWNPSNPSVSKWLLNGAPIPDSTTASYEEEFVSAGDFATTGIKLGNCIGPFVYLVVRIDIGQADPVYIQYQMATNTLGLNIAPPVDRAPTGTEIAQAAEAVAAKFPNVPNDNDCHWISAVIGAAMGAPLPDDSFDLDPNLNKEGGFWRIVHRGTDNAVADWQNLTRPGDIVRFSWADPSPHTTLIVGDVQADGSVMVVDNGDFRGNTSYIGRHLASYDQESDPASVTIYRIAADQRYLIETTNAPETVLGTTFNDLLKAQGGDDVIKAGTGNDLVEAGNGNDTVSGESGNDILNGHAGNDTLDGGAGLDIMTGGIGNDTYRIDSAGDKVVEAANAGTDTVSVSLNYVLAAGLSIETLQVASGVTKAISLTGNALVNTLIGNAASNALNGAGGADIMQGGGGNDIYFVDNAKDRIVETAGQGTDTVRTSTHYTLAAGVSVETLQVQNGVATAISLTGNGFANAIIGNAAANVLNGVSGNDALVGGSGRDFFRFTAAPNAVSNRDTVRDFVAVDDAIAVDNAVFAALETAAGSTLAAREFLLGSRALDADDHIIYNQAIGALIYDANGSASGGAIWFATLSSKPAITNADILVI